MAPSPAIEPLFPALDVGPRKYILHNYDIISPAGHAPYTGDGRLDTPSYTLLYGAARALGVLDVGAGCLRSKG